MEGEGDIPSTAPLQPRDLLEEVQSDKLARNKSAEDAPLPSQTPESHQETVSAPATEPDNSNDANDDMSASFAESSPSAAETTVSPDSASPDSPNSSSAGIKKEVHPVAEPTPESAPSPPAPAATTAVPGSSPSTDPPEVHPGGSTHSGSVVSSGLDWSEHQPKQSDYVNKKQTTNRNSLELRKLPVSILLQPAPDEVSIGASTINDSYEDELKQVESASASLLHKTCLNANFSLRMQMMLSFGTVSSFTIIIVVVVSLVASILAGDRVADITLSTFDDLAQNIAGTTAHYLADDLTPQILPQDLIQIIHEATRDRFAGYPTYADDSQVPFPNAETDTSHYPLVGKAMPLDWQMENGGNVNESNYYEHVQDRLSWYDHSPTLDTASAAFFIQGMCDPSATDPNDHRYFPNCTDANNDISTGGVIAPASTTEQIHRKASDLNPLLKSLYEYHQDVKNIGIYFSNSGAGASVVYPHYELKYQNTYNSSGCNWMLNDHPVDPTRTLATLEDFQRCELGGIHTNKNVISSRLYNPLDREWCRDQAMDPSKVHHVGPFESAWSKDQWLMAIGRAVYDRVTKDFVACIAVDFVLDSVEAILLSSKVTPNSEVSVVRFNEAGSVVASTAWDRTFTTGAVAIDDLHVGVSKESYEELYNLVNYKKEWDPDVIVKKYETKLVHGEGYLVATYPMPPVPEIFDRNYEPEFLVVVSVAKSEFFQDSSDLREAVDDTVVHLERIILIVGFVGLGMMVIIIFMVANALTFPLTYMNTVAADIINNFGDTSVDDSAAIEVDRKNLDSKFVPKTELDDIVKEFLKMVRNFSGSAMAKSTREKVVEIDNRFSLVDEFRKLYDSRLDSKFKYRFPQRRLSAHEKLERRGVPPYRLNFGRNVSRDSLTICGSSLNTSTIDFMRKRSEEEGMRSPLFFWIVVLIVTPLLLTAITISCILMVNVSRSFPDYVDDAKEQFVQVEVFALETYVGLRANLTTATTERAVRDLHVLTRYTNWLLNGGLNLTDSFTQLTTGVEECKKYDVISECPYAEAEVCDCAWGDRDGTCSDYSEDTRYFQSTFWAVQSSGADADGDRPSTVFPKVAYSTETTEWWDNQTALPGSENAFSDSRHETTYDRVRITSGIPVFQVLYNYDKTAARPILGTYLGFEDDGLMTGYDGCGDPGHPGYSNWSSKVTNGAYDLRPELCPLGKYGYDPRCRSWYHKGAEAHERGQPVYATPPYQFASSAMTAQSATSALFDAESGKHVGQSLVDFVSQPILDSLNEKNFALAGKGFPILITVETDNFEADTVIGPGLDGEARPIAELVLPNDPQCTGAACDEGFFAVLRNMKAGENGKAEFSRVGKDGNDQTIYISYAPVEVKAFSSIDSTDFSRGVSKSPYLLYSLAFAEYEDSMLVDFYAIEDSIETQFYVTLAVLCVTILISTFFVVYFSKVITVSMTEPMLQLLDLVRTINRLKEGEMRPDPPIDRQYGSREVLNVTCTMERLYKVIRSANTAFFAGDVETAYDVLKDALKLFKRLGNSKAIGVACNNLGNTLLAAYRTLKATKEKRICGFKKKEIIAKGTACFHEAIQQGEKAYDDFYEREGWSPNCLDFMQHLSNRYFNRAMFLLTVKDDHAKPDEIHELGTRDLQISRDMDVEINDEGTQVGWNVRGVDKTYEVMLSRFKGHLALLEMGYPDDFELEEWLDEAVQLVRKELKNRDSSPLFESLGPAGRMQQIELELMKYYVIVKDIPTAAKIGIRMLVEDEFTLPSAQLEAVKILQNYADQGDSNISETVRGALTEYRRRVEVAVEEIDAARANQTESYDEGASEFMGMSLFGGDMASSRHSNELSSPIELTDKRRISLMQSSRGDITMEMF